MIVFVRHGETVANREGRLLGRADPPLSDRGRRQAARLAARLAGEGPGRVLSSPLLRARATAAAVARAAGRSVEVDERLVELDYGEWDGRRADELPPAWDERWRADPGFAPPGGERLGDVRARVVGLAAELLAGDGLVVAVSHVSPIKAAAAWAVGGGDDLVWRMHLSVASVTRVAGRHGRPHLVSFNDTGHLVGGA